MRTLFLSCLLLFTITFYAFEANAITLVEDCKEVCDRIEEQRNACCQAHGFAFMGKSCGYCYAPGEIE